MHTFSTQAGWRVAHKAGEHAAVPGKIPLGEGEKRALVDPCTMALFWEVNEFSSAAGTRTYLL